jgi:hypothetical protein
MGSRSQCDLATVGYEDGGNGLAIHDGHSGPMKYTSHILAALCIVSTLALALGPVAYVLLSEHWVLTPT